MNLHYLYSRSRICFFCIPVRGGVVILSCLGMLLGLIMVIIAAVSTDPNRTALDVQAALYSLLAVASLFGLIGAIQARKTLIDFFLWFLLAHLFLSIISGIFVLVVTFQNALVTALNCPKGPGNSACIANIQVNRNLSVPGLLIIWAIHFYGTWVVKNYRDQLLEESSSGDDDEKALISRMDKADISAPQTTYAGPLETTLAPNQGTYNPNRPLHRNFSRPNRGPSYTSEVNLPSAATRTKFPDPVKTTASHQHKRSLSNSTYFDPTQFYHNSRNSEFPDRYSGYHSELPPPVPSRYTQNFRRDSYAKTHSRSESNSSFSSDTRSDASSGSQFSEESFVSYESIEEMLKPRQASIGSSLSSVPSLRRPPQAVVPVRF